MAVRLMPVFYNDTDQRACATLREMIAAGIIADGDVDGRDVATIQPSELDGYNRVHLFAGIGGFEIAASIAGWPDDRQLWTGGFPCQPFSVAGRRAGAGDDRYLWPEFERLIQGCRPEFVLVENVAAIDSEPDLVLDRVLTDLEALGYETWAAEIPACAVDAAHERNRVWIMAHSHGATGREIAGSAYGNEGADAWRSSYNNHRLAGDDKGAVGDAKSIGRVIGTDGADARWWQCAPSIAGAGDVWWIQHHFDQRFRRIPLGLLDPAVVLAHGLPSRTVALHGLGNSIVPQIAAEILRAALCN